MATLEQVKVTVDKVDQDLGFVTADLANISDELQESVAALAGQISALNASVVDPVAGVESTPYTIESGYNMFGYTGPNGIPIVDALGLALDDQMALGNIELIKDQYGNMFIPGLGGGLTSLVNGRGYYLKNNGPAFTVNFGVIQR